MIYLAGPLFTAAERRWNLQIAEEFEKRDVPVFLPQRDAEDAIREFFESDFPGRFDVAVAEADIGGLLECDTVLACLDGPDADSGTAWEMGFFRGLGFNNYESPKIYWYRTDYRGGGDTEESPINLMLSGTSIELILPTKLPEEEILPSDVVEVFLAVTGTR